MTLNELFATKANQGHSDMLDDILDGKPMMIVDSPQLRRDLRKRRLERALEWNKEACDILAKYRTAKGI